MKKYNWCVAAAVLIYLCLALGLFFGSKTQETGENLQYKVEIHEVMNMLLERGAYAEPDLSACRYLRSVAYLPAQQSTDADALEEFYENHNGVNSSVQPLIAEDAIQGYVRFDYVVGDEAKLLIWWMEGILFVTFVLVMALLIFIKVRILKPFHAISRMPYELSKGHFTGELEESKERFFGKFIWGIAMLRDTLQDTKAKELKLLREKKLLLLSISHDIKIPLSAIKLYAKALREGMYQTAVERERAAGQIEVHAKEIEDFVREIAAASSEDILTIEVENSEFYLKDYVDKIRSIYQPKAEVALLELEIGDYENRLLKGDMERAVEVMENLLENAFKYGDGKRIVIDFFEEDYCQVVRVFNTGSPVPAKEMPHLFDSFYRGSNVESQQGNGLGLYIARQIMNKMDGEVYAERQENGMRFGIVFRCC